MITAKTQLVGNIGSMEATYTPAGQLVVKGTVAVNSGYGDNKTTDWYRFVAWGNKTGDNGTGVLFNNLCRVGTTVYVEGRQKFNHWVAKSGEKRLDVEITVQEFIVIKNGKNGAEKTPFDAEASESAELDQMLDG